MALYTLMLVSSEGGAINAINYCVLINTPPFINAINTPPSEGSLCSTSVNIQGDQGMR